MSARHRKEENIFKVKKKYFFVMKTYTMKRKRINGFGMYKSAKSFEEEKEVHKKFW